MTVIEQVAGDVNFPRPLSSYPRSVLIEKQATLRHYRKWQFILALISFLLFMQLWILYLAPVFAVATFFSMMLGTIMLIGFQKNGQRLELLEKYLNQQPTLESLTSDLQEAQHRRIWSGAGFIFSWALLAILFGVEPSTITLMALGLNVAYGAIMTGVMFLRSNDQARQLETKRLELTSTAPVAVPHISAATVHRPLLAAGMSNYGATKGKELALELTPAALSK